MEDERQIENFHWLFLHIFWTILALFHINIVIKDCFLAVFIPVMGLTSVGDP
jgi:hypothetical protein